MNSDDDQWIMVEDEFLSTAQVFTRSVHRKEYERLQLEAASKNASQISSIQRPVTGTSRMSKETLKKREIAAKRQMQQSYLSVTSKNPQEDDSSDDEDLDPRSEWAHSELRTLMRGNTGSQASLSSLIRHKPVATRAAAGFTDSQISSGFGQRMDPPPLQPRRSHNEQRTTSSSSGTTAATKHNPPQAKPALETAASIEDEDDDLDAPVVRANKPKPQASGVSTNTNAPTSPPIPNSSQQEPPKSALLDLDDDLFPVRPTKPSTSRFKGRATAARERALKEEQAKSEAKGQMDSLDTLFSF
jgi:hypothetical protein